MARNNVKIRFQTYSCHPDRIFNSRLIIYSKLLRKNMDNFFAGRHYQLIHIFYKLIDILSLDFII